ncbi:MAG: zf-HC2 domain-containing protein [Gemmatimonadota bacterium]
MRHPDAGRLQAFIDGELSLDLAGVVERHVLRCPTCQERVAELQAAESRVGQALGLLEPVQDLEAARWEARRRWAVRRSATHRKRLAAAAVALLFVGAGAAAAMPGSPIRAWLGGDTPAPAAAVATEARGAALAVGLVEGRGRVELDRGVRLELRTGPDDRIRVAASSPGAFDTGAGWVRVTAHGTEAPVRLELPAVPHRIQVLVGGALRLEIRDGVLHRAGLGAVALPESDWLAVDLDDGGPDEQ